MQIVSVNHAPLMITSVDQLRSDDFKRLLRTRRPLLLSVPELPEHESAAITARVNDLRNECGCGIAATCAAMALALSAAWLFSRYGFALSAFVRLPLVGIGAVVIGGIAKMLSVTISRRRVRTHISNLVVRLSGSDPRYSR